MYLCVEHVVCETYFRHIFLAFGNPENKKITSHFRRHSKGQEQCQWRFGVECQSQYSQVLISKWIANRKTVRQG
jgi:hypothetical protein